MDEDEIIEYLSQIKVWPTILAWIAPKKNMIKLCNILFGRIGYGNIILKEAALSNNWEIVEEMCKKGVIEPQLIANGAALNNNYEILDYYLGLSNEKPFDCALGQLELSNYVYDFNEIANYLAMSGNISSLKVQDKIEIKMIDGRNYIFNDLNLSTIVISSLKSGFSNIFFEYQDFVTDSNKACVIAAQYGLTDVVRELISNSNIQEVIEAAIKGPYPNTRYSPEIALGLIDKYNLDFHDLAVIAATYGRKEILNVILKKTKLDKEIVCGMVKGDLEFPEGYLTSKEIAICYASSGNPKAFDYDYQNFDTKLEFAKARREDLASLIP